MPEALMRTCDVKLHYRGLKAVDGVSLELQTGAIHALIGTNGAGKSTLVGLLSGEYWPSHGRIELDGVDVTDWRQPRRARAGIGRSYQRSSVFEHLSALENCRRCAQAGSRGMAHWLGSAGADDASTHAAMFALQRAGLAPLAAQRAGALSHGTRRQLEVAMCLACRPRILLLDEPLAGMGAEETDGMLELLASLRTDHAILLVEHDMDAVFRIADRITVMTSGQVLASGTPAQIRADAGVRAAYLGEDDA
jgi:branched-chain amino acid transport system ATP-binding protein